MRRAGVPRPAGVRRPAQRAAYTGVPRWLYFLALLAALLVVLPLAAIVARVNWTHFLPLVTSESALSALGLSLRTSATSTVLCIILGVPLALVLARGRFPLQGLLRSLVLLPLVLPPVVGGIALLYTFGRQGLLGGALEVLGLQIAFSTAAVVLAQTFVALPFLVVSLEGALRTGGHRYEAAAATLGATPGVVFRRVTLPLMLPGLASGAVLAFARSLGEFGATLTFAGSLQGVTRTLPLEIYLQRETDPDAAVALSLVLVAVAVAVVALAYRRPGRGGRQPASQLPAPQLPDAGAAGSRP
jgi:molybdate transport system permease protein